MLQSNKMQKPGKHQTDKEAVSADILSKSEGLVCLSSQGGKLQHSLLLLITECSSVQ